MKREFEFKAKPSGDGEAFYWEVDRETYIKVTGHEPPSYSFIPEINEDGDFTFKNRDFVYSKTRFQLHPEDIFSKENDERIDTPLNIKIQWSDDI